MGHPSGIGIDDGHKEQTSRAPSRTAREMLMRNRWGVILAGGDGTRLQPLTRLACGDNRPKQFCPLLGGKTLLAQTRQRISRAIDPNRVLFALTKKHEPFYREELKHVPRIQQVVQPYNQGTLPAILWCLFRLFSMDQHGLVAFFPSDHYFSQEDEFIYAIERAFDFVAGKSDSVILLGAAAERPETEYGWIQPEHTIGPESTKESGLGCEFAPVRRFWEKPPLQTARELLSEGCLWNTFVMVGSAGAFLEMVRGTSPVLFEMFNRALSKSESEVEERTMQLVYDALDPSDFSKDVLALSTERLLVASCGEVGWSDLGEPRRFIAALAENGEEPPWDPAEVCNKCGLTHEQIVTLSRPAGSTAVIAEDTSSPALID